ncbi:hypothetical protein [Streptomyces phaeochromogenes]
MPARAVRRGAVTGLALDLTRPRRNLAAHLRRLYEQHGATLTEFLGEFRH